MSSSERDKRTGPEIVAWMHEFYKEIPVLSLLGAEPISYDTETGEVVVAYFARDEFLNIVGSVQGGILTAMLDNAMSFAVLASLNPGHVAPSLEIKTSYVAPGKAGRIIGKGNLVRRGRTIAFMEGKLFDPEDNLIATATGTATIRKR